MLHEDQVIKYFNIKEDLESIVKRIAVFVLFSGVPKPERYILEDYEYSGDYILVTLVGHYEDGGGMYHAKYPVALLWANDWDKQAVAIHKRTEAKEAEQKLAMQIEHRAEVQAKELQDLARLQEKYPEGTR